MRYSPRDFFKKKSESVKDVYKQRKILAVYKMFVQQIFREIF